MRVLVTKPSLLEVEPGRRVDLDAHHEYYLEDEAAAKLIKDGRAVELDIAGRPVTDEADQAGREPDAQGRRAARGRQRPGPTETKEGAETKDEAGG